MSSLYEGLQKALKTQARSKELTKNLVRDTEAAMDLMNKANELQRSAEQTQNTLILNAIEDGIENSLAIQTIDQQIAEDSAGVIKDLSPAPTVNKIDSTSSKVESIFTNTTSLKFSNESTSQDFFHSSEVSIVGENTGH
jgi:hypothetical protein